MHDHDHAHDSKNGNPAADEHGEADGGWLRPAVFGVSDGLVSNAALVLGVAAGQATPQVVLLAGIAGLLAGAFSMAAGEWISVQAQREAFEHELQREKDHIARYPLEEAQHMASILGGAGLPSEVVERLVHELASRPEANLDFHARIELGIDPSRLDSPWVAAGSSFLAFCLGAVLPLLPWFGTAGPMTVPISIGVSSVAVFAVGAVVSRFTARSWVWSGLRQLLIAIAAAGVTALIGYFIGA